MPSKGVRDDIALCGYGDCLAAQSEVVGVKLCDHHALKVYREVEATLRPPRRDDLAYLMSMVPRGPGPGTTVKLDTPGTIYYLRLGNRVKIGFTTNIERRMREIPHEELLGADEGTPLDEQRMHAACAPWHVTLEWFQDCPDLRAIIGCDTRLNG